MKRDRSLIPLSHQHQHGLALCVIIDRALDGNSDAATASRLARSVETQWEGELRGHFAVEERAVFPLADGATDLVARLLDEHRLIRRKIEELAPARDADLVGRLREFAALLRNHIRAEERELFEFLQRELSPDEMENLGTTLAAELPAACPGAPPVEGVL